MSRRPRRNRSAVFKAKVGLDAIRGEKTLAPTSTVDLPKSKCQHNRVEAIPIETSPMVWPRNLDPMRLALHNSDDSGPPLRSSN